MKNWLFITFVAIIGCLNASEANWRLYQRETLQFQKHLPGWCSSEKAEKLMQLIYDVHPNVIVEIGVFGGSSLYPALKALKYLNAGIGYAIDPWSTEECLKGYAFDDPNYLWWKSIDLNKIYEDFNKMLTLQGLSSYCNIMRMNSQQALSHFPDESIDILHIDGNHSEASALVDVQSFLPKLKKGGYLWFDDVTWDSTKKAIEYVTILGLHHIRERSTDNCFLFLKDTN